MSKVAPFKEQVYEELVGNYSSDNLFEDPLFDAADESLYSTKSPPNGIIWKRPFEVYNDPKFISDDINRNDMNQGAIGNCWFIAGVVGIMGSPNILQKVVPSDQSFEDDYTGMFHFRFWLQGDWVDVVIDDRLPYWQKNEQLVFSSNTAQPNELWASLLEKAYAKLYGNYENLEAGLTTDALIDMSGGLKEDFAVKDLNSDYDHDRLWRILFQSYHKNSMLGCSIHADPRIREARLSNGLVRGHAYTITKLAVVSSYNDARIIRLRNPWGNSVEWKGSWSDKSGEWDYVSDEEKEKLDFGRASDGEFWMSFDDDFLRNIDAIEFCHLSAESFSEEITEADDIDNFSWRKLASDENNWKNTQYHSKWEVGTTAGGCGNNDRAKFWSNPQFIVSLNDVDADDSENSCTIIVSLMQKDARLKKFETGDDSAESIQFRLYKIKDYIEVDETRTTGLRLYANSVDRIGSSGSYINSREVTKRFKVEPGNYLIIPSTYEDDRSCEFLLRVMAEKVIEAGSLEDHKEELDEEESFFEIEDVDDKFSSWNSDFFSVDDE